MREQRVSPLRSTFAHENLISYFLATSIRSIGRVCYDRGAPARSGQVLWFGERPQPQPQVCDRADGDGTKTRAPEPRRIIRRKQREKMFMKSCRVNQIVKIDHLNICIFFFS